MTVVSNTTPLNYLILIGEIGLAEALYGQVLVPDAVVAELRSSLSPPAVQAWALSPPAWLDVRSAPAAPDDTLDRLQAGEREAILLASQIGADLLLMDERAGRRAAEARGLQVVGTFAVLMDAGWRGLVEFEDALERLRQTTFHATDALFEAVRERYAAGRPAPDA